MKIPQQFLDGLTGIITSTKAIVVVPFMIFCCIALWTKHFDSGSFATLMAVVIPAWLGAHMAQNVWGSSDTVVPPPPPPNPAKPMPEPDPSTV